MVAITTSNKKKKGVRRCPEREVEKAVDRDRKAAGDGANARLKGEIVLRRADRAIRFPEKQHEKGDDACKARDTRVGERLQILIVGVLDA